MISNRAGTFITQPSGYKSFLPKPLPPEDSICFDGELISLLSEADRQLGRLDGITQTLPDPDIFVAMYVQKEALLSSQIEGTQASLSDVLAKNEERRESVEEVVNYVSALNYGLERLNDLPLSLRLIKEIHKVLLRNGRGSLRNPGEFRTTQNWVGPAGCNLNTATYVPPAVPDMTDALYNLENFFYEDTGLPPLVQIALIHSQFESIHPFLDGNGRIGRLLITFWLYHKHILSKPLLYLSHYFKMHRLEYYDRLMNVRTHGDWEGWIKFFLKGISFVSDEAVKTARDILTLKNDCERLIQNEDHTNTNHNSALGLLFTTPIISIKDISEAVGISYPTASRIVDDFLRLGILEDFTPDMRRNKRYKFTKYLDILEPGTEL